MLKNNEVKNAIPLFAAIAALLIAVPVRVYQYSRIINPETGFFDEINASVYVLYIVLALAVIIGIIVPFMKHNTMKLVPVATKSTGYTVVSLLLAVTLIVDSAVQLMTYFDMFSAASLAGSGIKAYISAQGGNLLLLQSITGALSAVYFFVTGVAIGLGNSDSSKFKILALLPSVWCIFRLLYRFKRTISFVNVSDLLLELFFIVFSLMFFFALAQINSKIDTCDEDNSMKNVFWKIFGYGIPAAVIGLTIFLPRFICLITGKSECLGSLYKVNYSDFAAAVYAIYTCISATKAQGKITEE